MSALPVPALNLRSVVALEILQAHFRDHGKIPAQYKVALRLGLSPSSTDIVRAAYMALENAGFIRRLSHDWRRIKLVDPKEDDAADIPRRTSLAAQFSHHRKLVQGLQVSPEASLVSKLRGLRPLSTYTKAYWLLGFPSAPERSAAS